ncbi:MAG: NUDIX hydrolase [Acidimicrobiia bacterium]
MAAPEGRGRRFGLLQQLERFQPAPEEWAAHAELVVLLSQPGDPFSRYRYDPGHITAGGLVISRDRSSVLLIRHPAVDAAWIEPGGHVEPGDRDIAAAARREVIEETGVTGLESIFDGVLSVDAHAVAARRSEPAHTHFNVVYGFAASFDAPAPSDEIEAARWHPVAGIDRLTSDAAVRRGAQRLRTMG